MTIDEFRAMVKDMVMARTSLASYLNYLQHTSRKDKYLREEYLAIQAVLRQKQYSGNDMIELGEEKAEWDARIKGRDLLEVVQAQPQNEHVIRKSVAGGYVKIPEPVADRDKGAPSAPPNTGPIARFLVQAEHSHDHLQFPTVIVDAIEKKHAKNYGDERILIVVFDGDYSFENDSIVQAWVKTVRQKTRRGNFKEILMVELARQKAFVVF